MTSLYHSLSMLIYRVWWKTFWLLLVQFVILQSAVSCYKTSPTISIPPNVIWKLTVSQSYQCCSPNDCRCFRLSLFAVSVGLSNSCIITILIIMVKVKVRGLYSAFIVVPHTQAWITQFYLQITPCIPLPHKRSPDGASLDWGYGHLIAVYYSII